MNRDELARHLDQLLDASRGRDYCPNGLPVEPLIRADPRHPRPKADLIFHFRSMCYAQKLSIAQGVQL